MEGVTWTPICLMGVSAIRESGVALREIIRSRIFDAVAVAFGGDDTVSAFFVNFFSGDSVAIQHPYSDCIRSHVPTGEQPCSKWAFICA